MENFDESIVQSLVLIHFNNCPTLGTEELRLKTTWCALSDCPERREADRRIKLIRDPRKRPKVGDKLKDKSGQIIVVRELCTGQNHDIGLWQKRMKDAQVLNIAGEGIHNNGDENV